MIGCFIEAWPQTLSKDGQTKNIKLRIRIIDINCLNSINNINNINNIDNIDKINNLKNINNIDSDIVCKRRSTSNSGTILKCFDFCL